jgi:hypothetical protein
LKQPSRENATHERNYEDEMEKGTVKEEDRASSDEEEEIMRSEIDIYLFQFSIHIQSIGLFFTIV